MGRSLIMFKHLALLVQVVALVGEDVAVEDKIKIEDFMYIVETEKSFLKAVDQKGWVLFQIYDVRERLVAKGFKQGPLKIIEICSGKYANALLNKNKLASLCMPCKINVWEENNRVKIVGMSPTIISQFFPEISQEETKEIERDIKEIIDNSK